MLQKLSSAAVVIGAFKGKNTPLYNTALNITGHVVCELMSHQQYNGHVLPIFFYHGTLLSCQPRVAVTSCFAYKVIRALESIDHLCINPICRIGLIHK